jgi:hypothetical protein
MSWPVEKILEEALKLDPTDRAFVIAELCRAESSATPEEVEAAWRDEIARRVRSIEEGTADTVDGRELSQRVRAEYKS